MAWINRHPNMVTWAVLSVGMVAIVGYSARDVDTLAGRQWFWLAFVTVLVAGLCAWIISWEADDDDWEDDDGVTAAEAADAAPEFAAESATESAAEGAAEMPADDAETADARSAGGEA